MPVTIGVHLHDRGQALWPEWFDEAALEQTRKSSTPRTWAALYMQRPIVEGGGIFKEEWWIPYGPGELPKPVRAIISVDGAYKTGVANDYSVLALWAKGPDGDYWLVDVLRDRWEMPELALNVHLFYQKHRRLNPTVVIEDAASGQGVIPMLRRPYPYRHKDGRTVTYPVLPVVGHKVKSTRSKVSRMEAAALVVQGGLCHVPDRAPWLAEWLMEHAQAPAGAHDDQVDTTTQALEVLHKAQPQIPERVAFVDADVQTERGEHRSPYFRSLRERKEQEEFEGWVARGLIDEADADDWQALFG